MGGYFGTQFCAPYYIFVGGSHISPHSGSFWGLDKPTLEGIHMRWWSMTRVTPTHLYFLYIRETQGKFWGGCKYLQIFGKDSGTDTAAEGQSFKCALHYSMECSVICCTVLHYSDSMYCTVQYYWEHCNFPMIIKLIITRKLASGEVLAN